MNTLTAIGYLGGYRVYLNLDLEEAKRRYQEETGDNPDDYSVHVTEFEDVFYAYEVGEASASIVAVEADRKREERVADSWPNAFGKAEP
jgi:thymidylate kinase